MKIGIIGYGIVGKEMTELMKNYYEIFLNDINNPFGSNKKIINKCDLGVICVPTPQNRDGSCNTSIVEEVIKWLETPLIIIKSTVEPEFTKKMQLKYNKRIVFSPEYIGESKYYNPYYQTTAEVNFIIFGGHKEDTQECVDIFKPILGPTKQYFQTDSTTAEIVKYMENSFFATKITFCNEFYEICKAFGVNYDEVREMWLADKRINRMHTVVFKNNRGYNGKCLPKDILAVIKATEKKGYNPELLKQVIKSNDRFRSQKT